MSWFTDLIQSIFAEPKEAKTPDAQMGPLQLLRTTEDRGTVLVEFTPPQTSSLGDAKPTKGCYCFVIDVSGSMCAAADVKSDDGDKVSLGFNLLDIGKHATNTFISSLEDEDLVAVVTYGCNARVHLDWTRCDEAGRAAAIARVNQMVINGSTNLVAGIEMGFKSFQDLATGPEGPRVPAELLETYAQHLIVCTDGQPNQKMDYAPLVAGHQDRLVAARDSPAARVNVTTIGLGNSLDSALLLGMADQFLHMPDPGAVGPFMVNLLANARSTAVLGGGAVANRATLVVRPASALVAAGGAAPAANGGADGGAAQLFFGWPSGSVEGDAARLPIGALGYDQPRHFVLRTAEGAALTVDLELNGAVVCSSSLAQGAAAGAAAGALRVEAEVLRLAAVNALCAAAAAAGAAQPSPEAPIAALLARIAASAAQGEPAVAALRTTLADEALVGMRDAAARRAWGAHYCRTLPLMLRTERRSNFRDVCLQHFGRDAAGAEALFAEQSDAAELAFATLAPPTPSRTAPGGGGGGGGGGAPVAALPAEYMRGGGCFAPEAALEVLGKGTTRVDAVVAGDVVRCADGGAAAVRCVVLTECAGGRAVLVRLPGSGLELTEWHPVRAADGRWHFPLLLGETRARRCAHVYNLVLEANHVPLVNGVGAVTLGHGLTDAVVRHDYWGGGVLRDLQRLDGWAEGRVLIPCAHAGAAAAAERAAPAMMPAVAVAAC